MATALDAVLRDPSSSTAVGAWWAALVAHAQPAARDGKGAPTVGDPPEHTVFTRIRHDTLTYLGAYYGLK